MHPSKQTKDKVGYARLRPSHCEPNPYNICRCAPNQRSRFQSIFVLIVCVLLPTVNGFRTVSRVNCIQAAIHTNRLYTGTKPSYASRQVPGIASLFEKNLRMKFTCIHRLPMSSRALARRSGQDSSESMKNLPADIVELNRILEERAAANRREQEERRRTPPPRRPDVRMPRAVSGVDDERLWQRLPDSLQQRYRQLRVLGSGAFGEVVLVADTDTTSDDVGNNTDHPVAAVKIVRARAGGEEPLLLREGVVLSLLPGPPHSPRCIDFGVCRGACYFIVE